MFVALEPIAARATLHPVEAAIDALKPTFAGCRLRRRQRRPENWRTGSSTSQMGDAEWKAARVAIEAQNALQGAEGGCLCPLCEPSSPSCLNFRHKGHDGRTKVTMRVLAGNCGGHAGLPPAAKWAAGAAGKHDETGCRRARTLHLALKRLRRVGAHQPAHHEPQTRAHREILTARTFLPSCPQARKSGSSM